MWIRAGCVEPFEDADGTDIDAHAVGDANVKVHCNHAAVNPEYLGRLDGAIDIMVTVLLDHCTLLLKLRVDRQGGAETRTARLYI